MNLDTYLSLINYGMDSKFSFALGPVINTPACSLHIRKKRDNDSGKVPHARADFNTHSALEWDVSVHIRIRIP